MKPKLKKVTNHEEAMALMNKEGDCVSHDYPTVKLGHNTYLIAIDYGYKVTYHGNPIIFYYDDETIISNCGWHTNSTTERLNQLTKVFFRIRNGKHEYYDYLGWKPLNKHGLSVLPCAWATPPNKQER
tara:strand:+ start:158 stop:541 length:384 start_codon:yes stop_codon:yes gene_type:complete